MGNYELTVLINNDLDEKARDKIIEDIKGKVSDGGKIIKEDLWGSRNLAYPIKHQTLAFYAHFEFENELKSISSLDKNIRLNEDIIRYLLIRK